MTRNTEKGRAKRIDCGRITYMWELWTGLYMLDAWEKLCFSESHGKQQALVWRSLLSPHTLAPHPHLALDGFLIVCLTVLGYWVSAG